MKWLARLKKIEIAPEVEPTKPTKPSDELESRGFVGFVGSILAPMQKTGSDSPAANDPAPTPETATDDGELIPNEGDKVLTGKDADTFTERLAQFIAKGVTDDEAEQLAVKLVTRDRDLDDRRLCLECTHLAGDAANAWQCRNWQRAGVALKARDAGLPGDLVRLLQRCDGFKGA